MEIHCKSPISFSVKLQMLLELIRFCGRSNWNQTPRSNWK